jgi:hypothetical protein
MPGDEAIRIGVAFYAGVIPTWRATKAAHLACGRRSSTRPKSRLPARAHRLQERGHARDLDARQQPFGIQPLGAQPGLAGDQPHAHLLRHLAQFRHARRPHMLIAPASVSADQSENSAWQPAFVANSNTCRPSAAAPEARR